MTDLWTQFYYMLALVFRGSLVIVATLMVCAFPVEFIKIERWGWGFAAGGAFMTLPVLYSTPSPTPFDGWAGTLFAAGVLVACSAKLYRGIRHKRVNDIRHPGWKND